MNITLNQKFQKKKHIMHSRGNSLAILGCTFAGLLWIGLDSVDIRPSCSNMR